MNSNPLSQYFRQPAIYIRLPSKGNHYPEGALDMPPNGEIPVLPMTTLDEITYRTPDALFNGTAVIQVIQSCVPNIKNAWAMPSMDIDTVLVAIRVATYGHEMDIDSVCPACSNENRFGLDLRTVLDRIKTPDYNQTVQSGDLEIHFRPMSYKDLNDNNLAQFEDQKMLQMAEDENLPIEQRTQQIGEILKKLTDVTIRALAQSIRAVKTPQSFVHEQDHIVEWLGNCDRALFAKIRDHIVKTKQSGEIPPLDIKCSDCGHEYQQVFTLNMTDFFEGAS